MALSLALATGGLAAGESRSVGCDLSFTSKEWSLLYARARGKGVVFCDDGSSMGVAITAKGLGVTAGKWKITDGRGKFSHVHDIVEVLGTYLAVSGEIGLIKAGTTRLLSKGDVSLALAGSGKGINVGVAFSEFTISTAGKPIRRRRDAR
jgi:hypothetical protein